MELFEHGGWRAAGEAGAGGGTQCGDARVVSPKSTGTTHRHSEWRKENTAQRSRPPVLPRPAAGPVRPLAIAKHVCARGPLNERAPESAQAPGAQLPLQGEIQSCQDLQFELDAQRQVNSDIVAQLQDLKGLYDVARAQVHGAGGAPRQAQAQNFVGNMLALRTPADSM